MKKYSIPRQLWRIIYPFLIFFIVSEAVVFVTMFIAGNAVIAVNPTDDYVEFYALVDAWVEKFSTEYFLWFSLAASLVALLVFYLMWRRERVGLPVYENAKLRPITAIMTTLLFGSLNFVLIAIIGISGIIQYFPSHDEVTQMLTTGSFLVQILALGIVGPIVEELLCRGIVLNRLCSWMPKWAAVLISSLLFGVIHFNLFQGIYAFFMGIVLSVLYLRYRNIWVAIIAHIAFNMGNIMLRAILETVGAYGIYVVILLLLSVAVSIGSIIVLKKFTKAAVPVPIFETECIDDVMQTEG